jgi:hypothetical protein
VNRPYQPPNGESVPVSILAVPRWVVHLLLTAIILDAVAVALVAAAVFLHLIGRVR